jgi:uncharacterized membrane protein YqiK
MKEEKKMHMIAVVALMTGALIFLCFVIMIFYAARFRKVPPDTVMVVYGKGTDPKYGYTVVGGGGKFIFPIVQSYRFLPTDVRVLELKLKDVLVKNFEEDLPIQMVFIARIRPSSDSKIVHNAVQNLLSKDDRAINYMGEQIIEFHIRKTARNMQIYEINSARDEFTKKVDNSARKDLNELGLDFYSSSIMKFIDDEVGFFEGLARKKIEQEEARTKREIEEKLPPKGPTEEEKKATAYNEHALSLMDQGFYERALTYFDKALKINPNEPAFNLNRERCQQFIELEGT